MIIETAMNPEEDLDLLCNTLNAEAGRFLHSDNNYLYCILIRAQMAIMELTKLLDSANELSDELKDMLV